MSSLHNDLDSWASKARARGLDRIDITNETANELAKTLRHHQRLLEALELALTGGNHIASELVGRVGPGFSSEFPPDEFHEIVLRRLGATVEYEMWCAWSALMRARDIAEGGDA